MSSDSTVPPPQKRQKLTHNHNHHHHQPLIPGLPDDIAQLCLTHLNSPSLIFSVCKSWRRLLYSPSFPPFLSLYTTLLPTVADSSTANSFLHFSSFDPLSSKWDPLPPPPPSSHPPLLHHHPSFLSRNLPIQTLSVAGNLIIVAATTHDFTPALTRPLLFNPIQSTWTLGPRLITPRRWCAAGSIGKSIYIASGIGSQFSDSVARSVEKWDLINNTPSKRRHWRFIKLETNLKHRSFSRDAIDAIGWRGKLCMVNVNGDAAKEGVIYESESDTWINMPFGMLKGWRGPVAAMNEETMYTVDESKGVLRRYDDECDCWVDVVVSPRLIGAKQMAAAEGKVCVVCGGVGVVVVDVTVEETPRIWVVDTPPGFRAISIHILPRMSRPDFGSGCERLKL